MLAVPAVLAVAAVERSVRSQQGGQLGIVSLQGNSTDDQVPEVHEQFQVSEPSQAQVDLAMWLWHSPGRVIAQRELLPITRS